MKTKWQSKTRGGDPVRILCKDRRRGAPIIGLVLDFRGKEDVITWHKNGRYFEYQKESDNDLLPVEPELVDYWPVVADIGHYLVSTELYPDENSAKKAYPTSFIRLATELPPIKLPKREG